MRRGDERAASSESPARLTKLRKELPTMVAALRLLRTVGRQFVYLFGTAITVGIWWLVEGFILPRRLRDQRYEAAISALRDLRAIRAAPSAGAVG